MHARVNADRLAIELENGLDPAPRRREGGVGLATVRARRSAQYGSDVLLRIAGDPQHFSVVLDLPARAGDSEGAT